MFLSGVQNALPGFPAKPLAGRPPKTCLHAEVRRFSLLAEAAAQASTQACGMTFVPRLVFLRWLLATFAIVTLVVHCDGTPKINDVQLFASPPAPFAADPNTALRILSSA